MSGIEVIELIGIICVTAVILALLYVTKFRCNHDWEKVDDIAYYDSSYSKYPTYRKYIYRCKKCGKFKTFKA